MVADMVRECPLGVSLPKESPKYRFDDADEFSNLNRGRRVRQYAVSITDVCVMVLVVCLTV